MKEVKVYTMNYCPYCESAKRLLSIKKIPFQEILLDDDDDDAWKSLEEKTGFKTMPQIFIGEQFIGGFRELEQLSKNGELEKLVQ